MPRENNNASNALINIRYYWRYDFIGANFLLITKLDAR